jgi:hypothetical protein
MTDEELIVLGNELASYAGNPVKFVEEMFDWDCAELKGKHPLPWQLDILQAIRDGLPLGKAIRLAVASGHGIGKTCLVSWIILWAMSTCTDCRGIRLMPSTTLLLFGSCSPLLGLTPPTGCYLNNSLSHFGFYRTLAERRGANT